MDQEGILNLGVYNSSTLKQGENDETIKESFGELDKCLARGMERYRGKFWHKTADNIIWTFPSPSFASEAALSFSNELALFNQERNQLRRPMTVRMGITAGRVSEVPKDQRGQCTNKDLDVSRDLEKRCPPGRILICRRTYEAAGPFRPLFRCGPPVPHGHELLESYVFTTRHLTKLEQKLLHGLSDGQGDVIPAIPFPDWQDLKPSESLSLRDLQPLFEDDLLIILAESRDSTQSNSNVVRGAATSDAIGVVELICSSRSVRSVMLGIDEWEDTQDYATNRNIIVVGSGIVNTYAYAFNDLIRPLRFERNALLGNIVELIVASNPRYQFGHHALFVDNRHSALLVLCNNPFNVQKKMLWMAGISGIATSASARLALDLLRHSESPIPSDSACQRPVACAVVSKGPSVSQHSAFWARWRMDHYSLEWMIDHNETVWHK